MNSTQLLTAIINFLKVNNWAQIDPDDHPLILWKHVESNETITLPSEAFILHRQANFVLDEAIQYLSNKESISFNEFKLCLERYLNNVDIFSFRTAGKAIKHGKIQLSQGATAISAIDGLVKFAANQFIVSPKNKTKLVNEYLSTASLAVPLAGSFIHNVEFDLGSAGDSSGKCDETESINRYINTRLAKTLITLQSIDDSDLSIASLIRRGISPVICRHFVSLFGDNVEQLECNFRWSALEAIPDIGKNTVTFDRSHRDIALKIQNSFKKTKEFKISGASAHIEGYKTPKGRDPILTLKVIIDGKPRTCRAVVTDSTIQELMKEISSSNLHQVVSVTATGTRFIENAKPSYHITTLEKLSLEEGKTIPMNI